MNGISDRMVTINRRRLLATATSFAIGASLCRTGLARWPNSTNDGHPFSPARTVVLPRRLCHSGVLAGPSIRKHPC